MLVLHSGERDMSGSSKKMPPNKLLCRKMFGKHHPSQFQHDLLDTNTDSFRNIGTPKKLGKKSHKINTKACLKLTFFIEIMKSWVCMHVCFMLFLQKHMDQNVGTAIRWNKYETFGYAHHCHLWFEKNT